MKRYLLAMILLVLLSCTINNSYTVATSQLTGKVVDSLSNPLTDIYGYIQESNAYFMSNNGTFYITGLYEGTFNLRIQVNGYFDTVFSFSIMNNEKKDLGDIVVKKAPQLYRASFTFASIPSYNVYNSLVSLIDTLFICGDTLKINIDTYNDSLTFPISFALDSGPSINGTLRKRKAEFKMPITSGQHSLIIKQNEQFVKRLVVYNGAGNRKQIRISCFSTNYRYRGPDFDIHFVNDNNDTCNYRHPFPNGAAKIAHMTIQSI